MSFADQKRHVATGEDCKRPWSGGKNGKWFKCYMCGHKFTAGDGYRFVFFPKVVNFMVCDVCDGDDVTERFQALADEFRGLLKEDRFWWFRNNERNRMSQEFAQSGEWR
jgi:hypothetical protein